MSERLRIVIDLGVQDGIWSPGFALINDYKYGLYNMTYEDKCQILSEFSIYLAGEMRDLLKKRIHTQYRSYMWKPLTAEYKKFKDLHNLSPNIWEATGHLVNSIVAYKQGSKLIVGIAPNKRYPKSKVRVLDVARYMEFGTRNMPARPLFGPTIRFMRRHVREYWELFLLEERGKYNAVSLRQGNKR